jgi:4-diphosphocytidyl-2-C-methyl-D-erythritol kinase
LSEPALLEPKEISLTAPCKVNLTLDVFAPRADGYHDLDSVVASFAPPADRIKVSIRPGARRVLLICKDKTLPRDERNLAVRAATAYLETFLPDVAVTVYVKLEKMLPVQAGLGGGSSDAATVLQAMNSLFDGGDPTRPELLAVASQIGSDVPLFLYSGMIRMQGRGEQVTPIRTPIPPLQGILVKPEAGVPTGPAYALLDALPHRTPGSSTANLLRILEHGGSVGEIGVALHNDFEEAIFPNYPDIALAHQAVQEAGAIRAVLCGSGAAVFGLAQDRDHARSLAVALAGKFPFVKMAIQQSTSV